MARGVKVKSVKKRFGYTLVLGFLQEGYKSLMWPPRQPILPFFVYKIESTTKPFVQFS
jgi:hypothetical protein